MTKPKYMKKEDRLV